MISTKRKGPGPVLRITVERRNGKWSVIDRFRAPEMTISSTEELPSPGKAGRLAGAWVEAVDADGNTLYRQMLREPPRGIEVFQENGSISRVNAETDQYTMDLLIPDLPEIEAIHLYVEEPEAQPESKKAWVPVPIAVFPAHVDKSPKRNKKDTRKRR